MAFIILIGRVLYGMIFVGSGVAGHLMQTEATAGYAQMRGVPSSKFLVQLSGVLIALGGLGIILGVWVDLAALGMALYSLIGAFMVHHFWTDDDAMMQQMEMTQFMKNLALGGGGLILFALWGLLGEEIGLSITGPVFDLSL